MFSFTIGDDQYARYQRPKVSLHLDGREQNTRTIIDNLDKIADACGRDPSMVMAALKCALHTSLRGATGLKGVWTRGAVESALDNFVKYWVLCDACDSPETHLKRQRPEGIRLKCCDCGHRSVRDSSTPCYRSVKQCVLA